MNAQESLLDAVRQSLNLPSDNALAAKIGVSRQSMSVWRKATVPLPDERIAQLCALAKLDAPAWLASIHAERATDSTERKAWLSILDRLRPIAAAVGLVAVGMAWSGDVQASNGRVSALETIHYAKLRRILVLRRLRRALAAAWTIARLAGQPANPARIRALVPCMSAS